MAAPTTNGKPFVVRRQENPRNPKSDIVSIRRMVKDDLNSVRKKQKEKVLTLKRLKFDSIQDASESLSSQESVEQANQALSQLKHGDKLEALHTLRRLFCKSEAAGEEFIRQSGVQPLMSCLASHQSQTLHAAAWCCVNLTATCPADRLAGLAPLLATFLRGSDSHMQELCAWALGNMAADSLTEVLVQQGCVPALTDLLMTEYQVTFVPRTQSVLFALRNFALKSLRCVRCLQDSGIHERVQLLLGQQTDSLDLLFELGWLVNAVYSRPETWSEHSQQCEELAPPAIAKMVEISSSPSHSLEDKQKTVLPYLQCVANLLGQSTALCVSLCESTSLLACLTHWLTPQQHSTRLTTPLQREALRALINCFVEPSCRVLSLCQPKLLAAVIQLSLSHVSSSAQDALYLLDSASHISAYMCQYLLQQGIISTLTPLLSSLDLDLVEGTLDLWLNLVTSCPQNITLPSETMFRLQAMASRDRLSPGIKQKVNTLLNTCPS